MDGRGVGRSEAADPDDDEYTAPDGRWQTILGRGPPALCLGRTDVLRVDIDLIRPDISFALYSLRKSSLTTEMKMEMTTPPRIPKNASPPTPVFQPRSSWKMIGYAAKLRYRIP